MSDRPPATYQELQQQKRDRNLLTGAHRQVAASPFLFSSLWEHSDGRRVSFFQRSLNDDDMTSLFLLLPFLIHRKKETSGSRYQGNQETSRGSQERRE